MELKPITLKIPPDIDAAFRQAASDFVSKRELWVVASAALLSFLRSHPQDQAEAIKEVRAAQVDATAERLIQRALADQSAKVKGVGGRMRQQPEPKQTPGIADIGRRKVKDE